MPRKIYNENGSGKCSLNCTYNNPKQHVEKDDVDNKHIDKTTMTEMLATLMTTLVVMTTISVLTIVIGERR